MGRMQRLSPAPTAIGMIFLVLASGGGLTGCAHAPEVKTAAGQQAQLSDTAIQSAIRKDLFADLGPSASAIFVRVENGIATLSGEAKTLLEKRRAFELTGTIKGVEAIVDNLKVRPEKVPDRTIKERVENGLASDPATASNHLGIKVENGDVTLTGTGTWAEHQAATEIAMGTPGVKHVKSQIRIEYPAIRSDAAIQGDVNAMLNSDIWLAKQPIHAVARNGYVSLIGTVETLYQKKRAFQDSWVDGALGVMDEDLKVVRTGPILQKSSAALARGDADVKSNIERTLRHDPRVSPQAIRVHVLEGGVTLKGTVGNFTARQAAEEDAKDTVGVTGITNFLNIEPLLLTPDFKLAERVRSALSLSPFPDLHNLHVAAREGMVVLSGRVASPFERSYAERLVGRIKGVNVLDDRLDVDRLGVAGITDLDIKSALEQRFRMDPYVDPVHIDADVRSGTVTLKGKIDTWFEGASAVRDAYLAGAATVNDDLRINPPARQAE